MRFILGSQSPRRKEILSYFSLPFVQIPSDFDEESIPFLGDPKGYVSLLSVKKAEEVAKRFPEHTILTADTVVFFEGEIFNKPKDEKEAFFMLKRLSGQRHQVFSAMTLRQADREYTGIEETKIVFNSLCDEQIRLYHKNVPCLDKAGAYGIQGAGSLLVSKIEGCYTNVMGLPVNLLRELLGNVGIDLWDYLG